MPGLNLKMRKDKRLLPAIALITAALLLTGEWFSCCRVNEAFAREIAQFARTLGLVGNATGSLATDKAKAAATAASMAEEADAHPHCHRPVVPSAHNEAVAATAPDPGFAAESQAFAQDSRCLSENAITRQSMVGSESLNLGSAPPAIMGQELPIAIHFAPVERPRPQNRSGPPVYLLTLRLLV
jgi:hypothetical protein